MAIKDRMEGVLTAAQLAGIRKRWGERSNGPWFVVGPPWGDGSYVVAGAEDPHVARPVCDCDLVDDYEEGDPDPREESLANAEFIAHSPGDIIRLLHHADAAQEVINAVAAFRDADRDCHASGISDEEREKRFVHAREARREMMRTLWFYEDQR